MVQDGHKLELSTCHQALNIMARSGDMVRPLLIIMLMKQVGLTPDMQAYTLAVRACRGLQAISVANGLLAEAKVAGLAPDTGMYSAMIKACRPSQDVDRALELFHEMEATPSCAFMVKDWRIWSNLMAALNAGGQPEKVSEKFEEMVKRGIEPSVCIYSHTLAAHAARGHHAQVHDLLARMPALGAADKGECHASIISAYASTD
ncbi:hypothetical protein JKP88DRAFT_170326 [Tribonema minus]|uniref:PROP1-like PPR domain-containing protein n=1 Tax=Tribonema minus TaxID=303371 RepID=A0A836C9K2_9STRA|nr:hypothetical protein JKP88DRAFT_170326 [Tribonema minus]